MIANASIFPDPFDYQDPLHLQLLLEVQPILLSRWQLIYNRVIKRMLDCVLALLALICFSPILIGIACWIRRDSPGPILFRQERVGLGGKSFQIYKFRSMYVHAPAQASTAELRNSASFITPVGAFLRRTSLDELPQLLNVLKGEMALVGPRPLIRKEADMDFLRKKNGVYQLRPGITGWAQVQGRDFVDVADKIALDRSYLRSLSFHLDVRLIFQTLRSVLQKDSVAF